MSELLNILVCDDNAPSLLLLTSLVNSYNGKKPDEASDGKMALDLISKNNYDIIFMDLSMPEIGGIEVIKEIRKKYGKVPEIVVVTGYSDDCSANEAIDVGANCVLVKPINFIVLKSIINSHRLFSKKDYFSQKTLT